ncbi:MAG: ABC transporter permease [Armatimonadetes bacterium]|nr:ABC transporter permease [Armatimonadota bacterium]MDE2205257.1 ABC transporter permease [Armatimonadota bacterium]
MSARPSSHRLPRLREAGILFFILAIAATARAVQPAFFQSENLRNILLDLPIIVTAAMGMSLVLLTRQIDLSVGSALGLCGMAVGLTLKSHPQLSVGTAMALGVGLGALLGAVNGALVTVTAIPPIIATLGTLSIYRGLAFMVAHGREIDPSDVPQRLLNLSRGSAAGAPVIVWVAAAVATATGLFLARMRSGRSLYAVGGNPDAARLAGINVNLCKFLAFVASGALAGLAAVLYASRFGFVNPGETGVGFELAVIAACVIGGIDVFGGVGSISGALLGCLLLAVMNNALAVTGLSGRWQLAAYGAMILLGIGSDALIRARRGEVSPADVY